MKAYYKIIEGVPVYRTFVTEGAPFYELVKFEGCCDLVKGLNQHFDSYGYPFIGDLVWDPRIPSLDINCSYDEYGSDFDNIKFCTNCGAPVELIKID